MILEKKIRFNNKDWHVKLNNEYYQVQVFLYDENGNILPELIYGASLVEGTLMENFKYAVLRANNISFKPNEYEDFTNWDGNMDIINIHSKENQERLQEFYRLSLNSNKTLRDKIRLKELTDYFLRNQV